MKKPRLPGLFRSVQPHLLGGRFLGGFLRGRLGGRLWRFGFGLLFYALFGGVFLLGLLHFLGGGGGADDGGFGELGIGGGGGLVGAEGGELLGFGLGGLFLCQIHIRSLVDRLCHNRYRIN